MLCALVDAGPLIAYYNQKDKHHEQICEFFKTCKHQLITTDACIAEVMYSLRRSVMVQMDFSKDIAEGTWQQEALHSSDFTQITELFNKYSDLPADFADLSLIVISRRLDITSVVTLDADFDIYRRYQDKPFERIFYPGLFHSKN